MSSISLLLFYLLYQFLGVWLRQLHLLLQTQIILQKKFQIMLLIRQINRQTIFLSQQILKYLTALDPPHAFLLKLFVLLLENLNSISFLIFLFSKHLQPWNDLIISLVHHNFSVFVDFTLPNVHTLKHTLFHIVRHRI